MEERRSRRLEWSSHLCYIGCPAFPDGQERVTFSQFDTSAVGALHSTQAKEGTVRSPKSAIPHNHIIGPDHPLQKSRPPVVPAGRL